jgi:hypothetical protein
MTFLCLIILMLRRLKPQNKNFKCLISSKSVSKETKVTLKKMIIQSPILRITQLRHKNGLNEDFLFMVYISTIIYFKWIELIWSKHRKGGIVAN